MERSVIPFKKKKKLTDNDKDIKFSKSKLRRLKHRIEESESVNNNWKETKQNR
jgi:hypothetical protein